MSEPARSLRSERTTVRRLPKRADYDPATVHAILDEGLVCHVAFVVDEQPYALPTAYARIGDRLVFHGSAASRMLGRLAAGVPVCATVTLLDGLVLARSAFHHSMNYRCAVILGRAREIGDGPGRLAALEAIVEHVARGRVREVRAPNASELKATRVLELPIAEGSAKVRTGPPIDDPADLAVPCWAGVVPLSLAAGVPIPAAGLPEGTPLPQSAARWVRP